MAKVEPHQPSRKRQINQMVPAAPHWWAVFGESVESVELCLPILAWAYVTQESGRTKDDMVQPMVSKGTFADFADSEKGFLGTIYCPDKTPPNSRAGIESSKFFNLEDLKPAPETDAVHPSHDLPVFYDGDLPNGATHCPQSECGYSIYKGVLVQWDEDHDERVLELIDQIPEKLLKSLLVIQEHKGSLSMIWADFVPDEFKEGEQWFVGDAPWYVMSSSCPSAPPLRKSKEEEPIPF